MVMRLMPTARPTTSALRSSRAAFAAAGLARLPRRSGASFWGVDTSQPDVFACVTAAGVAVVAGGNEDRSKGSKQHQLSIKS